MAYTAQQVAQYIVAYNATKVTVKDGIEWFRIGVQHGTTAPGDWLAVRQVGGGWAEIKVLPKNACGC